ncbi:uncharacterized protein LOC131237381 isoform X3 [Magnolia sinica]|uniref:uncharacterized protein LOC131237381 isoform X3 n=1 Tax=Magnolia sinica TaxID=86752 RepID=UPI0026593667|nr:uncharacterized protein LOC131237381 isoform X3 [Magnolia sinica]
MNALPTHALVLSLGSSVEDYLSNVRQFLEQLYTMSKICEICSRFNGMYQGLEWKEKVEESSIRTMSLSLKTLFEQFAVEVEPSTSEALDQEREEVFLDLPNEVTQARSFRRGSVHSCFMT